jgi:ribonuclease P/MRP protein subunit POP1
MSGTKRSVASDSSTGQAKRTRGGESPPPRSSSSTTTISSTSATTSTGTSRLQSLYADTYANERATELQIFVDGSNPPLTGLRAYQTLPRHQRRRAMAHNVNRVPQRLRERAQAEMRAAKPTSKAVRAFRKRSLRVKRDHARRQVDKHWLEVCSSHAWSPDGFRNLHSVISLVDSCLACETNAYAIAMGFHVG